MSTDFSNLQGALIAKYAVGRLENRDEERLAALSFSAIGTVLTSALPETRLAFAQVLAKSTETKVKTVLGESLDTATPEAVAHALNIGFAQAGLGQLHFERWGDVLTIRWKNPPGTTGPLGDLSIHTLQLVLQNIASAESHLGLLSADGDSLWLLLSSAENCALVTIEAKSHPPGALLARLQPTSAGVSQS